MIQTLSKTQMLNAKGGTSSAEYCRTLNMLIEHNWSKWSDSTRSAAAQAYFKFC